MCHTARSRPQTLIWTGVRPEREEALPRGIQAPSVGPDEDDTDEDDTDADSDAAKMHVLRGVSVGFVRRKSGDNEASDG